MKRFLMFFIMVTILCFSGNAMAVIKIKLGVVTKPGSAQNIAAEKFKELIEKRSNGNIKIQILHSASIGNEKAVRAVGNANGRNKIAIIIPCHRVIGSNGKLIGYASGVWRKEWLLLHERRVCSTERL